MPTTLATRRAAGQLNFLLPPISKTNAAMAPRDIDIALLRAFVAVNETGSMTAAARRVHLSQGAVSQQIKRLEDLFDGALFERGGERLVLTVAGERLLPHAHQMIALNDEVVGRMRGGDFAGEVRLGVAHEIVGMRMPAILADFRRRAPDIELTLVSANSEALRQSLRMREVDLAIVAGPAPADPDDLLLTDALAWVGAVDGEAFRRRPLPVAVCNETACGVRAATLEALGRAGIPWRAISHLGNHEPVFATVAADMAVSTFLSHAVPDGLLPLAAHGLPPLPQAHVSLQQATIAPGAPTRQLVQCIREGFARPA